MQYTVVLANDIAVPSQLFVQTWNADPLCRAVAYARLDDSTKSVYEAGVTVTLPLLEAEGTNPCACAIYPLIKRTLQAPSETEIVQIEKPSGARVLLVKPSRHH